MDLSAAYAVVAVSAILLYTIGALLGRASLGLYIIGLLIVITPLTILLVIFKEGI